MPFWAIVTEDDHHNAAPGAFILGSSEKANILAEGLKHVAAHVPNGKWDPNWMIDKDVKELKAIKEHLASIFTGKVSIHSHHASFSSSHPPPLSPFCILTSLSGVPLSIPCNAYIEKAPLK
jgi:hypothetical protein